MARRACPPRPPHPRQVRRAPCRVAPAVGQQRGVVERRRGRDGADLADLLGRVELLGGGNGGAGGGRGDRGEDGRRRGGDGGGGRRSDSVGEHHDLRLLARAGKEKIRSDLDGGGRASATKRGIMPRQ